MNIKTYTFPKSLVKPTLMALIMVSIVFGSAWEEKEAYSIFNQKGEKLNYSQLLKDATDADVILFGELHDNPICHWLQYELSSDIYDNIGNKLIFGAEMFEADNQLLLDEYLNSSISERNFNDEAKLWKNYKTDYKPLVEFAKEHDLPFIATNIPRRYASMVYRNGFEELDSLSQQAKNFIAPLPIEYDASLPGYSEMMAMAQGHGGENLPKAQAIKDATMAHFINENRAEKTFIHFNGTYHSNNFEGINWYLKNLDKGIKIVTIAAVEQDDVSSLAKDHMGLADYIVAIPGSMTKTY